MAVLVFDLDDTLYPEKTYVQSGFRVVASYIAAKRRLSTNVEREIYDYMWNYLERNGRGKVFDATLRKYQCYSKRFVHGCLVAYRTHQPTLAFYPDAVEMLDRFAGWPMYVITDGNRHVQRQKMRSLGLYDNMRACFPTYAYGLSARKPATALFHRIAEIEHLPPNQIVYFGDNPNKDFVGVKSEGFRTIRLLRGAFHTLKVAPVKDADVAIANFQPVTEAWLAAFFQNN